MLIRTTEYKRVMFTNRAYVLSIITMEYNRIRKMPNAMFAKWEREQGIVLQEELQDAMITVARHVKYFIDDKLVPEAGKYQMTDKDLVTLLNAVAKKFATVLLEEKRVLTADEAIGMFEEGIKTYYVEPTSPEREMLDVD